MGSSLGHGSSGVSLRWMGVKSGLSAGFIGLSVRLLVAIDQFCQRSAGGRGAAGAMVLDDAVDHLTDGEAGLEPRHVQHEKRILVHCLLPVLDGGDARVTIAGFGEKGSALVR